MGQAIVYASPVFTAVFTRLLRVSVVVAMVLLAVLAALMAVSPLSQWISLAQYNQEFFRLSK